MLISWCVSLATLFLSVYAEKGKDVLKLKQMHAFCNFGMLQNVS
jgi:hypothetical protein